MFDFDFTCLAYLPWIVGAVALSKRKRKTNFGKSDSQVQAEADASGTGFEDVVSSNPFENVDYENGIWDSFGDFFGFRTGQDKFREDLNLRSKEYLSQIKNVQREEAYNSEAAKVARLKQAGQNPDLQGLDQASQATEFVEPETSPESPYAATGADAMSTAIQLGANFTSTLTTFGNFLLSFERASLINEGLRYDNASNLLDLINNAGAAFDMPDVDSSPATEDESGIESTPLEASKVQSGRIDAIADAIFGKTPTNDKANFVRGMKARNGTLSALVTHLTGEAKAAVAQGDLNVADAQLKGRKSKSNAPMIEDALYRSLLNDAKHDAIISEIELKFAQDPENQENLKQSLVNEAIESAEYDPHLAAQAANAGFEADVAESEAVQEESKARIKEAELAAEEARYRKEQLLILEDTYETWKNGNRFQKRKYRRQMSKALGYGVVNEPSTSGNLSTGSSYNASSRRSTSLVRRLVK